MAGDDIDAVVCFPKTSELQVVAGISTFEVSEERRHPATGAFDPYGCTDTAMSLSHPHLLLITQDEGLRQTVLELAAGPIAFTVDSVTNHADALSRVKEAKTPYNFLLVDYTVPLIKPRRATKKTVASLQSIRSLYPSLDGMVITDGDRSLGIEALGAGAFDYIDKSVLKKELPFRIAQLLEIQQLKETRRERSLFKSLGAFRRELAASATDDKLLEIALAGVRELGFDRSRLYLLSGDGSFLIARAQFGMKDGFVGTNLPLEQCPYMQQLLKDQRPRVFRRDPSKQIPFDDILEKSDVFEWGSVPLKLRDKIIGKLSVDNKVSGHRIFEDDLDIIIPFASEAVEALYSAHYLQRVEALQEAIISITATENRDELLETITEEASRLVKARNSGIYAYYPEREELIVITDLLRSDLKGKKLRVGEGGAGNLVASDADNLVIPNYAESEYKAAIYQDEDFGSVLLVPLKSRQETIGVLYVNDQVGRVFSGNDIRFLQFFADRAALALTHVEHEERLVKLIESSPLGIIEVKRGGPKIAGHDAIVTRFNKAAQGILKYDSKEPIGKLVSTFYADPEEPKKIGDLLRQNNGKLSDHLTQVKTKDGKNIPIRHASTWVMDSAGRRNGSVGFFEDLTPIHEKERQIEILLNASNLIATADDIGAGLKGLAELMVKWVGGTFGRILLLDEADDAVVPKAAYRVDASTWHPAIDESAPITEWPLLRRVLREKKPVVRRRNNPEEQVYLRKLALRLQLARPIQSMLLVPLTVDDAVIGLLQIGEEREEGGTTFGEREIRLAAAIGAQTAGPIGRERARLRFESLFKASNALLSSDNPDQVLIDVVESARQAAGANSVSFVQIDEHGRPIRVSSAGNCSFPNISAMIRSDGNSMNVWENGKEIKIENTTAEGSNFNPAMKKVAEVGAAVCLPVSIQGSHLGVMWIHYREPRRFSDYDIGRLQLCVNQAALAYDSSRRISELKRIREAAKTLATVSAQEDVLKEIVASACTALLADSAVIWFYEGFSFVRELSQSHNIPEAIWRKFQASGPRPFGTARKVMDQGVLEIADVKDSNDLGESTQELLQKVDARRFLGISLKVGADVLGVLYVNYKQPRSFRPEEREMILSFANQAASALKRSRLLEQLERTRRTATSVAEVTTLGDLTSTLELVTVGTKEALGCDAVTLYVYDPLTNRLNSPPYMKGVWKPAEAGRFETVPQGSIVFTVLKSEEIITVPDVTTNSLFQKSEFVSREEIKSCAGVPLRVGEERVGVMFVSYRTRHDFLVSEVGNIKLFSNQAAIAIHNAKLFDRTKKDLEEREQFLKLSSELLGTLSLQETMDCATRFASQSLDAPVCSLLLPHDERRFILRSGVGWPEDLIGRGYVLRDNTYQSGCTIKAGEAISAEDLDDEPRFSVPEVVRKRNLKSAVSVPLEIDKDTTGVILVYSEKKRKFGEAEIKRFRLIANQAAIAMRSAHRHEATERAKSRLQATYDASKASTSVTWGAGREDILGEIVRRGVEYLQPQAVLGTLHTYDEETDELTLVTAYPPDRFEELVASVGESRPLQGNERTGYKMGIIGKAILTGETQIASSDDPDYVELDPTTKSELTVPIKENNKVVGALNIESNQKTAFDADDRKTIETLAELTLMVINVATQFKLVAARKALVFMGLSANNWYHNFRSKAIAIGDNALLVRQKLVQQKVEVPERLDNIIRLVKVIVDLPKLEALSSDEGVRPVLVNSYLQDRLSKLRRELENKKSEINVIYRFEPSNEVTVRVNPIWLEQALNVLIDNAVEAMRLSAEKILTIFVTGGKRNVVINVSDTGGGIPEDIRAKVLEEPIGKSGGLGSGLLIARFILQVYDGDISINSTGPAGTTMSARLPIVETKT